MFYYFMVEKKQEKFPELRLEIGDRITVYRGFVAWFSASFGIPQTAEYGFKVASLKNCPALFVDENGLREELTK